MDNENWDEADDWKKETPPSNKNNFDYGSKIVVNAHTKVPFALDNWLITNDDQQRVDVFHKNTYFSFVLGEKPYIEIYSTDQYGQLDKLVNVVELGDYLE